MHRLICILVCTYQLLTFALTPSQLFEKVRLSVVVIKTLDVRGSVVTQGSGVVLPHYKIATNCHVVGKGLRIVAGNDNKYFIPVTLYAGDKKKDLCILKVDENYVSDFKKGFNDQKLAETLIDLELTASGLSSAAEIGKASTLKIGEEVYAVGAPQGLELSLTNGIVSQLRGKPFPIIQTTAPVSDGSSGGGLFNSKGQLVGLTTLKLRDEQGFNFAIPVEWLGYVKKLDQSNY